MVKMVIEFDYFFKKAMGSENYGQYIKNTMPKFIIELKHLLDRIGEKHDIKLERREHKEYERSKSRGIWMAFKGLPKKERQSVIERLLRDTEFMEELIDIAILEQRREEPSRPLGDYLAERKR